MSCEPFDDFVPMLPPPFLFFYTRTASIPFSDPEGPLDTPEVGMEEARSVFLRGANKIEALLAEKVRGIDRTWSACACAFVRRPAVFCVRLFYRVVCLSLSVLSVCRQRDS